MRLKIGKKSKTASHHSKFTDSYQKRVNTLCTYYFIVDCSRVARISQGGGGFFWKFDIIENELDPNFH